MNYGCSDAAEALPAYALNALPEEERLALIEHLAECREHDEELAAYRGVASRLPLVAAASPAKPPESLRSSLLDAFDREVSGAPAAAAEPVVAAVSEPEPSPVEPAAPITALPAPRRSAGIFAIFQQPALAYGIAAALLIAVLGLTAWNLTLQDDGTSMLQASATAPGMSLNVEYYADQKVAVLNIDMPPPPAGQVYQAWMIADGKPVSMGVIEGNKGRMAFAADMAGATGVAVSQEPIGGSTTPSTVKVAAEF